MGRQQPCNTAKDKRKEKEPAWEGQIPYVWRSSGVFWALGKSEAGGQTGPTQHGNPGAPVGQEKIGRFSPEGLAEFLFETPGVMNVGKIVLLSCSATNGAAAEWFTESARGYGYQGKIVSYLRERIHLTSGPCMPAISMLPDYNMVEIKTNRAKYRVER